MGCGVDGLSSAAYSIKALLATDWSIEGLYGIDEMPSIIPALYKYSISFKRESARVPDSTGIDVFRVTVATSSTAIVSAGASFYSYFFLSISIDGSTISIGCISG